MLRISVMNDTILTSTPPTILGNLESNESDTPETSPSPADDIERPTTNKSFPQVRDTIAKRIIFALASVDFVTSAFSLEIQGMNIGALKRRLRRRTSFFGITIFADDD
jgi:hypothetical protein